MTKKDITKQLSEELGLTQEQARKTVQFVFDAMMESIVKTGRLELRNFGVFGVRRRKPRRARNPHTGQPVDVKEKYVVSFQPSKYLEDQVRKHGHKIPNLKRPRRAIPVRRLATTDENLAPVHTNGVPISHSPNNHARHTAKSPSLPNKSYHADASND